MGVLRIEPPITGRAGGQNRKPVQYIMLPFLDAAAFFIADRFRAGAFFIAFFLPRILFTAFHQWVLDSLRAPGPAD